MVEFRKLVLVVLLVLQLENVLLRKNQQEILKFENLLDLVIRAQVDPEKPKLLLDKVDVVFVVQVGEAENPDLMTLTFPQANATKTSWSSSQ